MLNLADYGRIRVMADRLGIDTIDREGRLVVLKFRPQAKLDPVRLVALVRQRGELTLVPPAALRLSLDGTGKPGGIRDSGSGIRSVLGAATSRSGRPGPEAPPNPKSRAPNPKRAAIRPSWWTARALEGQIKPCFNKEAMTRGAKEDPRAPGGVFEQVGGLLSELLDQG